MSSWKKVALVNMGGLLGVAGSLFILPPNTPLWIWATASVVCLAALNYFLIRRLRKSTGERTVRPTANIVMWLGIVVLLMELAFRYWHH